MTVAEPQTRRSVLRVRPGQFVVTPSIHQITTRALRYLHSGFSIHLRGPAGTGKTTLAMHLANCLARPVMLIFGDDDFTSSDLIGSQSGYTHKKLMDNYIHSVLKVEDELKHNWVDSRLTMACREGFTLVYDEFNRSRPEVNNVLLSALEEKILTLPPTSNQPDYLQVHSQFRAIFTSNPEEYCGVHATQDALMDRLVTINMPEPDELTQTEILAQKTGISREDALFIVNLVKTFRLKTTAEKTSGLRSCLMIAKVCAEHEIVATPNHADFRDICADVLLSRTNLPIDQSTTILWEILNENPTESLPVVEETGSPNASALPPDALKEHEQKIYNYLQQTRKASFHEIYKTLNLKQNQAEKAVRSLLQKKLLKQQDQFYILFE
ncbi:gas vesicle protein GvpN [Planktothrix sp. FACHB-1365]|uniref:gas vesicle protein GvpN n=1 Tax=Planktothrix sp. FACHB-1365 TaxID=2692855 RepID=UPI0016873B15|nr:gas vesicle protein GvpN [Planktothrix sp. FACHB-1365]MBD2481568.1 gas vesicle protein GvpN [Planktothrix sp. FACHB-1365]